MIGKRKNEICQYEKFLDGLENLNYKFLKILFRELIMPDDKKSIIISNIEINVCSSLSFEEELLLENKIKIIGKYFNKFYNELLKDQVCIDSFLINESRRIKLLL